MSSTSRTEGTESSRASRTVIIIAAAVVLLAFAPLLVSLGQRMWKTEHYSFFPLILLGSGVIAWQRFREFADQQAADVWDAGFRSPLLWVISLALLAVGVVAHSPWPAGVGFLLALRAVINSLFSQELAARLMPAWWFLWLAIPLPFNLDRKLILAMQLLATRLASGVLDWAGAYHSLSGVVIELPGKSFFVEEACSGVQSLFAAVSVTIFYSLLGRRGFVRTLLLTIFGIGWVLVANALRIIAVTVLSTRYQIPIDEGWAHEATGAAVFVLALLLIVSTDRLLLFLAPLSKPASFKSDYSRSTSRPRNPRRKGNSWWTIPAGVAALVVFGGLGFVQYTHAVTKPGQHFNILDRGDEIVNETSLPEKWNGWECEDFTIVSRERNDPNGQISRVWRFRRSGQVVLFSLDGPFDVWHDLGLCYSSQGWTVAHEEDHTRSTDKGSRYDYSELSQENDEGQNAFVAFTAFDQTGEQVAPPPFLRIGVGVRFPDAAILLERVKDTLTNSTGDAERYSGVVYQTQAYVESQSLLTSSERQLITELFLHLNDTLRQEFELANAMAEPTTASDGEG